MHTPPIVYDIYIAARPEQVWDALTNPDMTRRYFVGRLIESDWQVGSPWRLMLNDGRVDSHGTVVESDPPRLLTLTWRVDWLEEFRHLPESRVSYRLEPMGDVVRLTMTQSHPEYIEEKYLEGGRRGWPIILSGLKTLLETSRPMPPIQMSPPKV